MNAKEDIHCGCSSTFLELDFGFGRLALEDGSPGIDHRKLGCKCSCEANHMSSPNGLCQGCGWLRGCARHRRSMYEAFWLQEGKVVLMGQRLGCGKLMVKEGEGGRGQSGREGAA